VASWYTEALKDKVKTPVIPEGCYSSWAQYTIQVKNEEERTALQQKLKEQGIPTMVYYPKPMHEQTAYKDLKQYIECPVTERLCRTGVSLPLDSYKQREDILYIKELFE
jgi:dTDP-4-amino-4,6-dideoxygalactose transaminase